MLISRSSGSSAIFNADVHKLSEAKLWSIESQSSSISNKFKIVCKAHPFCFVKSICGSNVKIKRHQVVKYHSKDENGKNLYTLDSIKLFRLCDVDDKNGLNFLNVNFNVVKLTPREIDELNNFK